MVYKFRTMVPDAEKRFNEVKALNEADGPVFKIKKDPRIILYIGTMLRKTSLDELPPDNKCAARRNEPRRAQTAHPRRSRRIRGMAATAPLLTDFGPKPFSVTTGSSSYVTDQR